ncbi:hypothetical protein [Leisingera aquaemixtae]|uniref:hypothetical protein n=1 Tax=Leisingera aquaemixtae TaxID=1396826 RepID=UPI0021A3EC22|nr:hypothetical protein [Leisingera aquaemixtae]UWQ46000.1 hypothetical protein K3719_01175 [Leisingera aquaemixtae]
MTSELALENKDPQLDEVVIPDRYEVLARTGSQNLNGLIVPVESALNDIDQIFAVMKISNRGAFAILRGRSGIGKSTFLHTLHLYRHGVEAISIPGGQHVPDFLAGVEVGRSTKLKVIVLEEREAAISFTDEELESWLHAINAFIRRDEGRRCLVVWPCNSDGLQRRLENLAQQIGGKSLLGSREGALLFSGPEKNQFAEIGVRTLSILNQGAGLSDFGLTNQDVDELAKNSDTVGDFLGGVRDLVIAKQIAVARLIPQEQPKVWVVVVAGNEPAGDVAGVTRGNLSLVDMDRLMSSTDANVVRELKKIPEKLGVLATVLNAKVFHLPVLAATAAVRAFADEKLKEKLKEQDFSLSGPDENEAKERILQSEFGTVLSQGRQKTLTRGKKLGSKSRESFEKVAKVASTDDAAVNRAIGRALVFSGLIDSFEVEVKLNGKNTLRSDLVVQGSFGEARLEMMWRAKTGRADISNYTLKKLELYGKNIGLI